MRGVTMAEPAADDLDAGPGARLVLFGPGDSSTAGRRVRRAKLLAMRPVDPTVEVAPPPGIDDGVHWEYLQADDRALLVRTRDFTDPDEARWDADRVFATGRPPRAVFVRDEATAQLSWWLMRGDEPLIVASRVWLRSQRPAVVRHARSALLALVTDPRWGSYAG